LSAPESVAPNLIADRLVPFPQTAQSTARSNFRTIMTCAEIAADFTTSVLSICASYYLYFSLQIGKHLIYPLKDVLVVGGVVGLLVVLLLEREGAYTGGGSLLRIRETERAIRVPFQALLLLLPITFLLSRTFSRASMLIAIVLLPLLLVLQKHLLLMMVRLLHARGYGLERVVIFGAGYTGRRILSALFHSPKLGLRPVAVIDDDPNLTGSYLFELGYRRSHGLPVQAGPLTPAVLKNCRCDLVVVAAPHLPAEKLAILTHAARRAGTRVAFLFGPAIQESHWMEFIDIDGLLLTSINRLAQRWPYTFAKRCMDVVLSALLVLALSPLLIAISVLILLDSGGPVIFTQKRVGKDGHLFNMFKFRSMHAEAPQYGFSPTDSQDPRITRMGRFLRRTSLDELPQLFNVLLGDMSLVGPRPEMPFIVNRYNLQQRQRLQVVPGITGLWQLSADRAFQIHENLQYDLYYIRNRSFFMDMSILVHTLFFAMHGI
jgi:exopolysaccharide biosynthesis polyprenyl glycosylphosphotransferase